MLRLHRHFPLFLLRRSCSQAPRSPWPQASPPRARPKPRSQRVLCCERAWRSWNPRVTLTRVLGCCRRQRIRSPSHRRASSSTPRRMLSESDFFVGVLLQLGIELLNLAPNSILILAVFQHLCEGFLGFIPSPSLFFHFYYLCRSGNNPSQVFGCGYF